MMLSFTVINETTKTAENKMGNRKERDVPFQQKNNTDNKTGGLCTVKYNILSDPSTGTYGGNDWFTFCNQHIIVNNL